MLQPFVSLTIIMIECLLLITCSHSFCLQSFHATKSLNQKLSKRIEQNKFLLCTNDGEDLLNHIPETEKHVESLSNVKAVRYFVNLTNGIEAVAVLLKQGVPMEHINVSSACCCCCISIATVIRLPK
jgi:hypothetical protein